ncbi:histamine H2 receptor [Nematostella vectensis]|uniref:histamine H2 receptor n=1 Tax=Nematostella vectensis TaxID=45351 RepID=UPI00138FCAD1|nr:histamine H2 receptor [Nematostella vectensis]XP_032221223.1 histamine H2 receptor [Nematostella vectensis]XP_032221224.1 histamine H2 receptor [Nematostella vectensis]XP_032221225.1 histamine H2 receptor [Nematostella vectensis]XP_048580193.1 histamine H2 receptor [Nematostella vectensis]
MGFNCTLMRNSIFIGQDEFGGFHAATDVIFIVAAFLILVVNVFIGILISTRRDLRTSSNIILVSLAMSDGLTGLVAVPLLLTCSITGLNEVCITSAVSLKFVSIVSALHILLMTVDRYLFIVYAHKYYEMVRKGRVCCVLLLVWLMGIGVSLTRLQWVIGMNVWENKDANCDHQKILEEDRKEKIFNWFCLITFFFVPLLFTIILDAKLLSVLRTQIRKIVQDNLLHIRKKQIIRTKNRERRAVCVYLVVVTTFILCWLPYFLYDLWQQWIVLPVVLEYLIINIRFLTSLSNPVMYIMSQRSLRRAVVTTIYKLLRAKNYKRSHEDQVIGLTTLINRTDTTQV